MKSIIDEELALLARVSKYAAPKPELAGNQTNEQLLDLRDQIAESRLEDHAALINQMLNLSAVAQSRSKPTAAPLDVKSPYFGHLELQENGKKRDVLIGKTTVVDRELGLSIVDWRHAPVSRLYYCYHEGDDYEEDFAGKIREGVILKRRSVSISKGELKRIRCPQGQLVKQGTEWTSLADDEQVELKGGAGLASRPLGTASAYREDKHLSEITALIDPAQFEAMTKPDAGVVVLQGGAGCGKTTILLHRIAYLAYANPQRFRPKDIIVVVFSEALALYVKQVLPSLGLHGVRVVDYQTWIEQAVKQCVDIGGKRQIHDAPHEVSIVKKHPGILRAIDKQLKRPGRGVDIMTDWEELITDEELLSEIPGFQSALYWTHKQISAHDEDDDRTNALDPHDWPILLNMFEARHGSRLRYDHIAVDEAQDLSPVELKPLLTSLDDRQSMTLAGDIAQQVIFDNHFSDWSSLLQDIGVHNSLQVEPFQVSYRSTTQITEFAQHILGPLKPAIAPKGIRNGAPVEILKFDETGEEIAFLAEQLRGLMSREHEANVAILTRYPERADFYYEQLKKAQVPFLRRAHQSTFAFAPGIDVTNIAQAKGLEFDYVIIPEVTRAMYPDQVESRHLLHIAATRAAYQLWLTTSSQQTMWFDP